MKADQKSVDQRVECSRLMRRWSIPIGRVVLLVYLVWCMALYVFQDSMVFAPYAAPQPETRPSFSNTQIIRIDTPDGPMEGWFVPASSSSAERGGPVVVYCHGNAEIVDGQGWFVDNYTRMGCSVFLPEYRGYGRSPGKPSEAAIAEDCVQFYDALIQRPDVDPKRIAFHGRSLGGGVAAQLAARRKPAALILESTFASVASFAHGYCVPEFLVRNPFRTDRVIEQLDIPVLVIHGTRDEIIPVEHGRRLGQLVKNGEYVEYDCGHNNLTGNGNVDDYWRRIRELLAQACVIE